MPQTMHAHHAAGPHTPTESEAQAALDDSRASRVPELLIDPHRLARFHVSPIYEHATVAAGAVDVSLRLGDVHFGCKVLLRDDGTAGQIIDWPDRGLVAHGLAEPGEIRALVGVVAVPAVAEEQEPERWDGLS